MEEVYLDNMKKGETYYFVQTIDKEGLGIDICGDAPFDSDVFMESHLGKIVSGGHIMKTGDREFNVWNMGNSFLMVDWQQMQHYAKIENLKVEYK